MTVLFIKFLLLFVIFSFNVSLMSTFLFMATPTSLQHMNMREGFTSTLVQLQELIIHCKGKTLLHIGWGARAWGEDLIVFAGPGVGHLTDLALLGEGIFASFCAQHALGSIKRFKIFQYQCKGKLYFQNKKHHKVEIVQRALIFKRPLTRGR